MKCREIRPGPVKSQNKCSVAFNIIFLKGPDCLFINLHVSPLIVIIQLPAVAGLKSYNYCTQSHFFKTLDDILICCDKVRPAVYQVFLHYAPFFQHIAEFQYPLSVYKEIIIHNIYFSLLNGFQFLHYAFKASGKILVVHYLPAETEFTVIGAAE